MNTNPTNSIGPAETIVRIESAGLDGASARDLFHYADALRMVGRQKESLQAFDLLERLGIPKGKEYLVRLFWGRTYYDMGRFEDAEVAYRMSAGLNPSTTVPWVYLASALSAQERFEEAITVLERAKELPGDPDEVLLNIGLYLRALGRLEAAAGYLRQAIELTPAYPQAVEALQDIEAALASESETSEARSRDDATAGK